MEPGKGVAPATATSGSRVVVVRDDIESIAALNAVLVDDRDQFPLRIRHHRADYIRHAFTKKALLLVHSVLALVRARSSARFDADVRAKRLTPRPAQPPPCSGLLTFLLPP